MLWIIDSFSRFVQGKVILNKRVETIMREVSDTSILCFEEPTVGFYADNGGKFVNIKMDELIARLGLWPCLFSIV